MKFVLQIERHLSYPWAKSAQSIEPNFPSFFFDDYDGYDGYDDGWAARER